MAASVVGVIVGAIGASMLCIGGIPLDMHSSLTLWRSSSRDNPGFMRTFCASVIGDTHLTSSGQIGSMMLAASSSSIALLRYSRCAWVSCHW